MFLPGRMVFEFDTDANFASELPTTLRQPTSDCPTSTDMSGFTSADVRQRITRIMDFLAHGY
jgi:hypothetical protein